MGLTFHRPHGLDINVGIGPDTQQRFLDPVTGEEDVELATSARASSLTATAPSSPAST